MLAALVAVAANYGSKRDNEAGPAVRAVAGNAIEAFNFLMTINSKYDVSGEWRRPEIVEGGRGRGRSGDERAFYHSWHRVSYRIGRRGGGV